MNMPAKTRANEIKAFLHNDAVKSQLEAAMPKFITPERMIRVVFSSIVQNPKLIECSKESIIAAVMKCAQLGLEPILGRAYLIPYYNKQKRTYECQFQPGYQGLVDIARRSGEIANITAHVVHKNDQFELVYGTDEYIKHVPQLVGDRGEAVGVYTVWTFKDKTQTFSFMTKGQVEKVRAASKASNSGPWVDHWEEMAKKTVVKRHAKLQPASIEFMEAVHVDNQSEIGKNDLELFEEVVDVQPEDLNAKLQEVEIPEWKSALNELAKQDFKSCSQAIKQFGKQPESEDDAAKIMIIFDEIVGAK